MTNRRAGIVAAILCAAGAFSAVALAFELQRPVVVPYSWSLVAAESLTSAKPATILSVPIDSPVMEVAPVIIIGTVPHHRAPQEVTAEPRNLSEMHCTEWKGLEQGSSTQRVRLCS